ncbi:MAG: DUF4167 domain-containing protein [Alphaproteobacteria bacterium]|nr:MAG: DUF4167 domain-containing protein [Alphaproteobacteria bacterium]
MRPNSNRRGRNGHHRHGGGGHNSGGGNNNHRRGSVPVRYQVFESKGSEVKVRGNPQQIYDKYSSLARDALASGDHVRAESHFQHAEHYFRLLNSEPRPQYQPSPEELAAAEVELINAGEAVVESLVPPAAPSNDGSEADDKSGEAA